MEQQSPRRRGERGVVQVIVLLAMGVLLGFAALAVDNGYILATRTQLQAAADAGALAAMGELRGGTLQDEAALVGRVVSNLNYSFYDAVEVTGEGDVEFGTYHSGTGEFQVGGMLGATAVRVTAQRDLPYLLLPILNLYSGVDTGEGSQIAARAVASLGVRDVVVLQDITFSFLDEFATAQDAIRSFVQSMVDQGVAGDRFGLISFHRFANVELELTELPQGQFNANNAINNVANCQYDIYDCAGTNIGAALQAGTDMLLAQPRSADRLLVLISDGTPCLRGDEAGTLALRSEALAAAAVAREAGIDVYSIFLDVPQPGGGHCDGVSTDAADPAMMAELASSPELYYSTAEETALDGLLLTALQGMGMRLVE